MSCTTLKRKASADEPKAEIFSDYGSFCKILVGPSQKAFLAYDAILSRASPFFEAALKTEWLVDGLKVVEMPEDEPAIFQLFLDWLYRHELVVPQRNVFVGKDAVDIVDKLFHLYVFANKILARDCEVAIIAKVHTAAATGMTISYDTIKAFSEEVEVNDGLLELLCDWYAITLPPEGVRNCSLRSGPLFALALQQAMLKLSEKALRNDWRLKTVAHYQGWEPVAVPPPRHPKIRLTLTRRPDADDPAEDLMIFESLSGPR
ncbi:hypothetical protein ANO11243_064370 [Dothideomycetidae sp. 11243]|nr:hypothetical protein ANO11243_064370 [fungal sp. No.11243]